LKGSKKWEFLVGERIFTIKDENITTYLQRRYDG
jgi:hypothetical protein